jgi:hypothetical protein
MVIAEVAATVAATAGADRLAEEHVAHGLREVSEKLGRGLRANDVAVLQALLEPALLSGGEAAAKLFGDERIVALPPEGDYELGKFVVHPLLRPAIESLSRRP